MDPRRPGQASLSLCAGTAEADGKISRLKAFSHQNTRGSGKTDHVAVKVSNHKEPQFKNDKRLCDGDPVPQNQPHQ